MKEKITPNASHGSSALPEHSLKSARPWLGLQDVMIRDVLTISPSATVIEAARLMAEKNTSCILVVDHSGTVRGILSERDFLKKVLNQNPAIFQDVAEIMTSPIVSAPPIFPSSRPAV